MLRGGVEAGLTRRYSRLTVKRARSLMAIVSRGLRLEIVLSRQKVHSHQLPVLWPLASPARTAQRAIMKCEMIEEETWQKVPGHQLGGNVQVQHSLGQVDSKRMHAPLIQCIGTLTRPASLPSIYPSCTSIPIQSSSPELILAQAILGPLNMLI